MKYSQLSPAVKDKVNQVEKFIKSQIQTQTALEGINLDKKFKSLNSSLEILENKISVASLSVERDFYKISKLNSKVNKDLRNSDLISRYLSSGANGILKGGMNEDGFLK